MFFFAAGAWLVINRVEFLRKIKTACIFFGGGILATVILNVARENAIWLEYANKVMILAGLCVVLAHEKEMCLHCCGGEFVGRRYIQVYT